jgi:hypothetical protein
VGKCLGESGLMGASPHIGVAPCLADEAFGIMICTRGIWGFPGSAYEFVMAIANHGMASFTCSSRCSLDAAAPVRGQLTSPAGNFDRVLQNMHYAPPKCPARATCNSWRRI